MSQAGLQSIKRGVAMAILHSTRKTILFTRTFHVKFKENTNEMLHLEYSFVWCFNLGTSKSRLEIAGKFWNVVLEKDGEDDLGQS
jgi:hypothetical protein